MRILIVVVTAFLSAATSLMAAVPQAGLPQTGQTACWDTNGNQLDCVGTGQDGEKQAGTASPAPRFSDKGNGTVTDNLTGLVWLKNADCVGINPKPWAFALAGANNLSSGTCGLTDGSIAGDWRLPNRKELLSLLNRQQVDNSVWLNVSGFSGVEPNIYWTSSTAAQSGNYAWCVDMKESKTSLIHKVYSSFYVWPVRGGQ